MILKHLFRHFCNRSTPCAKIAFMKHIQSWLQHGVFFSYGSLGNEFMSVISLFLHIISTFTVLTKLCQSSWVHWDPLFECYHWNYFLNLFFYNFSMFCLILHPFRRVVFSSTEPRILLVTKLHVFNIFWALFQIRLTFCHLVNISTCSQFTRCFIITWRFLKQHFCWEQ